MQETNVDEKLQYPGPADEHISGNSSNQYSNTITKDFTHECSPLKSIKDNQGSDSEKLVTSETVEQSSLGAPEMFQSSVAISPSKNSEKRLPEFALFSSDKKLFEKLEDKQENSVKTNQMNLSSEFDNDTSLLKDVTGSHLDVNINIIDTMDTIHDKSNQKTGNIEINMINSNPLDNRTDLGDQILVKPRRTNLRKASEPFQNISKTPLEQVRRGTMITPDKSSSKRLFTFPVFSSENRILSAVQSEDKNSSGGENIEATSDSLNTNQGTANKTFDEDSFLFKDVAGSLLDITMDTSVKRDNSCNDKPCGISGNSLMNEFVAANNNVKELQAKNRKSSEPYLNSSKGALDLSRRGIMITERKVSFMGPFSPEIQMKTAAQLADNNQSHVLKDQISSEEKITPKESDNTTSVEATKSPKAVTLDVIKCNPNFRIKMPKRS